MRRIQTHGKVPVKYLGGTQTICPLPERKKGEEEGGSATLFFRERLDERVPGTRENIELGPLFNRVIYL